MKVPRGKRKNAILTWNSQLHIILLNLWHHKSASCKINAINIIHHHHPNCMTPHYKYIQYFPNVQLMYLCKVLDPRSCNSTIYPFPIFHHKQLITKLSMTWTCVFLKLEYSNLQFWLLVIRRIRISNCRCQQDYFFPANIVFQFTILWNHCIVIDRNSLLMWE